MRVLITCPRAPVSIEWIRIFSKAGCEIILVDSISFPIARYYDNCKFVKVASARLEFKKYKSQMAKLIKSVDWVIPNCEDIFYLSYVRDSIDSDAFFFMPNSELLFELHNKFAFFKHLNSMVKFPKTVLLEDVSEINIDKDSILKPVFSRFGKSVIRDINKYNIENIEISKAYPWVQQERIVGKAICKYALILNGKVLVHTAYEPKYLLNGAAATYFERYRDKRLDEFIEIFAKESNYTGQVAFDFIDDGKDLYVLECNPRATSGLHILSDGLTFEDNVFKYQSREDIAYRVGTTLYTLFGIKALFKGEFKVLKSDYKRAKDVLDGVSIYGQVISMFAMFMRALWHRKDITTASTFDIEYDGK